MRRLVVLTSVAILAAVLGVGHPWGAVAGEPAANRIQILGLHYRPNPNTVAPGTVIRVFNVDGYQNDIPHSLTSEDGLFDTGVFRCCRRRITAPSTPGAYPYFCRVHSFMSGTLIVWEPIQRPAGGDPVIGSVYADGFLPTKASTPAS